MTVATSSSSQQSPRASTSSSSAPINQVNIDYKTHMIVSVDQWTLLQNKNKTPQQTKAEGESSSKKIIAWFLGAAFLLLIIATVSIIAFAQNGYANSDKLVNIITTMVGGLLGYSASAVNDKK